jgi:NADH-quinone oxidoreductase subunit M
VPLFSVFLLVVTFSSIGLPGLNGFVGEFLILLGSFRVTPGWTAAAATGIILGAVYMLWMFRRVIFGPLTNPENQKLEDLNGREITLMAPILLLIVLMGVYPQPFLERMKPAVELSLQRILSATQAPAAAGTNSGGELRSRGR